MLQVSFAITHVERLRDDLCGRVSEEGEEGEEAEEASFPAHLMPSPSEALRSYRCSLCL